MGLDLVTENVHLLNCQADFWNFMSFILKLQNLNAEYLGFQSLIHLQILKPAQISKNSKVNFD